MISGWVLFGLEVAADKFHDVLLPNAASSDAPMICFITPGSYVGNWMDAHASVTLSHYSASYISANACLIVFDADCCYVLLRRFQLFNRSFERRMACAPCLQAAETFCFGIFYHAKRMRNVVLCCGAASCLLSEFVMTYHSQMGARASPVRALMHHAQSGRPFTR